jgi:predicted transcriptional regulator
MFQNMGNLQVAAKSLSRAREAVQLNRDGWGEVAIAERLGVTDSTVRNYLRRFLESQSLFGSDITPEEVSERRSLQRERLLANQEVLIERRDQLRALVADDIDEECSLSSAIRSTCDSIVRNSEALAALDGLNVKPDAQAITNNMLVVTSAAIAREKMLDPNWGRTQLEA